MNTEETKVHTLGTTNKSAYFKDKKLVLTKKTEQIINELVTNVKSTPELCLVVNRKKVLMQKIYQNLILELKNHTAIRVLYLEDLKAGTFTNHEAAGFLEPASVMILLTKNHNHKELNLLKELEKTRVKTLLLSLNAPYYHPKFFIMHLDSVKGLYWFMFGLANYRAPIQYNEFADHYQLTTKQIDFKALQTK